MKIKNLISTISFSVRSNSPTILLGCGIVGTIAGTILACVATTKVKDVKDDFVENIEEIHNNESAEVITEQEAKKALTKEYLKFGGNLIKLYAPSVIIEGLAIASIFGSNNILKKRSTIAMAAYAALSKAFNEYRDRVVNRFGSDVEKEIRYNVQTSLEEECTIDKNGKKKTNKVEKKYIGNSPAGDYSPFAMIFDETNDNWTKDPTGRKFFLTYVQNYCNEKLHARGYLFLNEVYHELGFNETKAGQIFGWLYKPDDPSYVGDGFVDFGIYDTNIKINREFVNGYEPAIILDFNVDGDILNLTNTKDDAHTIISKYMK